MIGWLLDTNVIAEIISASGSMHVKTWAAAQDEMTFHLSILTIAEYDRGIAKLPNDDARRPLHMTARDNLAARFAARLLPVSDAIVRRWGVISGTTRRDIGHPPPVIVTLLAATALEHNLHLATRNVRDVRRSSAAIFNPWEDDDASISPIGPRKRHRRTPNA